MSFNACVGLSTRKHDGMLAAVMKISGLNKYQRELFGLKDQECEDLVTGYEKLDLLFENGDLIEVKGDRVDPFIPALGKIVMIKCALPEAGSGRAFAMPKMAVFAQGYRTQFYNQIREMREELAGARELLNSMPAD